MWKCGKDFIVTHNHVDNLGGRGKFALVVVAILSSWDLDVQ
jgi:hypothetical protein